MLAYLAILGSALAGYAGVQAYAIAAAAIALASLSYSSHTEYYERGRELGLSRLVNFTLLRSLANGLVAASVAYGAGYAMRLS